MSEVAGMIREAVIQKANAKLLEMARRIVTMFKLEMQVARYEQAINKSRGLTDTEVRNDSEASIVITSKHGKNGLMEYSVSFKPDFIATCTPSELNELEYRFSISKQRALGRA